MTRRHFPLWTLLGVVLVVALLAGSGAFSSTPPTDAQRVAAIESVIRCPSCEDLTVAVSSAPTALTVRSTVSHLVAEGRTDQQVEDYLVSRYGSAIVLDPPASGWSLLVWVLPVLGGVVAAVVLATVLVRRRRGDPDPDADVHGLQADPHVVEERRRFLAQSLDDADAEYLAGDLSDADYLALRQRDLARLAALGPAPVASDPTVPPAPGSSSGRAPVRSPATTASATVDAVGTATLTVGTGPVAAAVSAVADPASVADPTAVADATADALRARRKRNRWFLFGAVACFVAALIVAVPVFASRRLPGQTATGSVQLSPSQQITRTLDQAATAENEGQLGVAAQLYQSVLAGHPGNEPALVQLGWLEYRIGSSGSSASLIAQARTDLARAALLAPGDYAVHLYQGTILLHQDGDAPGAVDQYRLFLADDPPATVLDQAAATVRAAFTQAGEPVPADLPAA
jgi:cytochrome c-type biogenesis protein CcmH